MLSSHASRLNKLLQTEYDGSQFADLTNPPRDILGQVRASIMSFLRQYYEGDKPIRLDLPSFGQADRDLIVRLEPFKTGVRMAAVFKDDSTCNRVRFNLRSRTEPGLRMTLLCDILIGDSRFTGTDIHAEVQKALSLAICETICEMCGHVPRWMDMEEIYKVFFAVRDAEAPLPGMASARRGFLTFLRRHGILDAWILRSVEESQDAWYIEDRIPLPEHPELTSPSEGPHDY